MVGAQNVYNTGQRYTSGVMMRTNIEIDDELLSDAMTASGQPTKKATVEEGLRLLVQVRRQAQALADIKGIGWDGDLDQMRLGRPVRKLK